MICDYLKVPGTGKSILDISDLVGVSLRGDIVVVRGSSFNEEISRRRYPGKSLQDENN